MSTIYDSCADMCCLNGGSCGELDSFLPDDGQQSNEFIVTEWRQAFKRHLTLLQWPRLAFPSSGMPIRSGEWSRLRAYAKAEQARSLRSDYVNGRFN